MLAAWGLRPGPAALCSVQPAGVYGAPVAGPSARQTAGWSGAVQPAGCLALSGLPRSSLGGTVLLGAAVAALHRAATARRGGKSGRRRGRHALRAADFDVSAWRRGFFDIEDLPEGYYFVDGIDLPEDLRGTLFRNGPGKFSVGDMRILHQLDGDGAMLAVSFGDDGKVSVRQRLTQTQGLIRDKFQKRIVSAGLYGTQARGGLPWDSLNSVIKNAANLGTLWWDEKLLALGPVGKPYLIDPACLGTIIGSQDSGETDLGGTLDEEVGFGATPKFCANTGSLVNFDQVPGSLSTRIRVFEFPDGKFKPRTRVPRFFDIKGYTRFMDFAVTQKWIILAQPPLQVDGLGVTLGKPAMEVLKHDPNGTGELIFATRSKQDNKELNVPVDGLVCEEFANAYELEDGRAILDVVAAESWDPGRPSSGEQPLWEVEDPSARPRTRLLRYEVDPVKGSWTKTILCDRHLGFATVNPAVSGKKHRYIFCAVGHSEVGVGPMAGVAKVDCESGEVDAWVPGPAEFGAQPVFVPRPGATEEDGGYLLSVVLDAAALRTDVLVFDARSPSKGPVCRFPLSKPLPHGLRGCWADGLTFTQEDLQRKLVLRRMFERKAQQWNSLDSGFNLVSPSAFFQKQGGKMR